MTGDLAQLGVVNEKTPKLGCFRWRCQSFSDLPKGKALIVIIF
jgi:hypothetical protein